MKDSCCDSSKTILESNPSDYTNNNADQLSYTVNSCGHSYFNGMSYWFQTSNAAVSDERNQHHNKTKQRKIAHDDFGENTCLTFSLT